MIPFAGKRTATAAGMITAATGIGGFSFTALTGLVAGQWGLQAALGVLAGFFVVALAAVFGINALHRRLDLQSEA
jgi:nitrate/nitrite transporter NarK